MNIDFYFDPGCPFCWITSRWLVQTQAQRDITINWRPISLALKNNQLGKIDESNIYVGLANASHRALRVILAAGGDTGKLYAAFGTANHIDGKAYDDELIASVLADQNLPAELIKAAGDTQYDTQIQASMDEALAIVGQDVGTPILIFHTAETKSGYFGPVLQSLPNPEDGVKLYDAVATLATTKEFYELKRTRPSGAPNVGSTNKLLGSSK